MIRGAAFIVVFLFATVVALRAQDVQALEVGRSVEGELSAGGHSAFSVPLESKQVVFGEVDQKNLDIVVTVYDPEGDRLARIDMTPGGWEFIHFESSQPGAYQIDLTAGAQSGPYAIRLDRIEAVATSLEGELDQWVRFLDKDDRPGGAVALVRGGTVTYAGAFGLADLTHRIPFTTNTPSNIGSVSKPFTAFAVELLEQEGKLSLDDDVHEYLPELPDFGQPVTLRHLLTHTAGFRGLHSLLSIQGRVPGRWSREDLIRLVQRQRGLVTPPGEAMRYTNTTYVLLAEVIERVTGMSFGEWMQGNVFEPLQMEHTTVKTHGGQIIPNSAVGYARIPGERVGWQEGDELDAFFGATGVYSTAEDLARWVENLGHPRVGGPQGISRMTQRCVLTSGDSVNYGLGLFIDTDHGLLRYHHTGEDGQRFAAFYYYPEIDAGIAYLSNDRAHFTALGGVTEDVLGGRRMASEEPESNPATLGAEAPIEIRPALLGEYAGRYGAEGPGLIIVFSREEDHLAAQVTTWWWEPQRVTFIALTDSTFIGKTQGERITFRRGVDGNVDRVTWGGMLYRRLSPYDPSEEDLTAFVGSYYSEELGVIYSLHMEDGKLRLTNPRLRDFEVRPWEPDVFRSVFPLPELRFRRGDSGAVTSFVDASGIIFKRLR